MPQGTRQHPRGPHPVRSTSIAGSVRSSTRCVSMALTVASLPRTSASSCLNSTCSNTPSTWPCCKPSSRAPARPEGGHFGQTGWRRWPFQRASSPRIWVNLLAAPAYYYRVIGSLVHRGTKKTIFVVTCFRLRFVIVPQDKLRARAEMQWLAKVRSEGTCS